MAAGFVEDAHVLILCDVGLIADDLKVLQQLAAELNARIVVAKLEPGLEDKIPEALLCGQIRMGGQILALGRADDDAVLDVPQLGIPFPTVEIRAIEQRHESFFRQRRQVGKANRQTGEQSEPSHGGPFHDWSGTARKRRWPL